MNKFAIVGIICGALLVVAVAVLIAFPWKGSNNSNSESGKVAGVETPIYFDATAKVKYYYSPYCSWCKEEAKVLEVLAKEGYRVNPQNVYDNPQLGVDAKVDGTPTFIAENGDRLDGYQVEEKLRDFLEKHK